ncbi:hypothetical protein L838_2883 [Mycobacterium avium MAV_120709_2344]|nr:hypothetical protein L838_2883 [Mycobacterium avium MAV_120709_2344]
MRNRLRWRKSQSGLYPGTTAPATATYEEHECHNKSNAADQPG